MEHGELKIRFKFLQECASDARNGDIMDISSDDDYGDDGFVPGLGINIIKKEPEPEPSTKK